MKSLILTEQLQQAVINGKKTQTRRELDEQPPEGFIFLGTVVESMDKHKIGSFHFIDKDDNGFWAKTKFQPGEIIYLREWFRVHSDLDNLPPRNIKAVPVEYKLGGTINCIGDHIQSPGRWRWHQTMPAHLARTFLKVTNVKVERLLDISWDDCYAEGVEKIGIVEHIDYLDENKVTLRPIDSFKTLWDSCYKKGAALENPWVFAYTFELCDREGNVLNAAARIPSRGLTSNSAAV